MADPEGREGIDCSKVPKEVEREASVMNKGHLREVRHSQSRPLLFSSGLFLRCKSLEANLNGLCIYPPAGNLHFKCQYTAAGVRSCLYLGDGHKPELNEGRKSKRALTPN
ncbi:hypothetical protein Prudu_011926 [Prunus dulcis]|uniref:Uncharacterized protein n=1 Tax=Prunus dulcis TaxID=3755 RepID=A0A4Y1RC96_PRUDU|nr:hypothetical protein Prudu_011926 [Prunus dulcis]